MVEEKPSFTEQALEATPNCISDGLGHSDIPLF